MRFRRDGLALFDGNRRISVDELIETANKLHLGIPAPRGGRAEQVIAELMESGKMTTRAGHALIKTIRNQSYLVSIAELCEFVFSEEAYRIRQAGPVVVDQMRQGLRDICSREREKEII